MPVRIGVVVFPGTNCDRDTVHALELAGAEPVVLWHEQAVARRRRRRSSCPAASPTATTSGPGVIARFSPVMRAVAAFAADGGLVLGICNGFQVLAEAGLVPGALLRNASLRFAGQEVAHRRRSGSTRRSPTRSTRAGRCGCPSPTARAATTRTTRPSTRSSATARSSSATSTRPGAPAGPDDPANPNGSLRAIAGVMNAAGNVAGLMPHPERAAEAILGSDDGARDHPLARRERGPRGERRAGRRRRAGRDDRGRAPPSPGRAAPSPARRHRRRARTRSATGSAAATRTTSSSRCSASCGASTARTRARSRCSGRCPTDGRGRRRRPGRERRGHLDRRRARGRVQDRVAQPPVAPSSRTRAPRPASAGSCATSSRWAPARSRSSMPCGSATRPTPRTRHLVDGVVRGVGGYGNCVGVPTVGGELVFDPSYGGNPLVNVMAIGLLEERLLTLAAAPGPGQPRRPVRLGDRARRDRRRVGPRQRHVHRRRPVEAARRSRSATRSPRSC